MKKGLLMMLALVFVLIAKAQFVLTPYDGLKTSEGAYGIARIGSQFDNYTAIKSTVNKLFPNARVREFPQENSITVTADDKVKLKFKDMFSQSSKFDVTYTLKFNAEDNKISIDFLQLGNFIVSKFGRHYTIYPIFGENNVALQGAGLIHVFNSSGETSQPKTKQGIEEWANGLVVQIRQSLMQ